MLNWIIGVALQYLKLFNCCSSHISRLVGPVGFLWLINRCGLFKVESCLYIYMKYMIFKHILTATFLNETELILSHISSLSSSSCRAACTDIPDPLLPLLPIVHHLWQVFRATSRILTLLLYVCSSWSSCFCPAICRGPKEYIAYVLGLASPVVSCMSGSSNLDSFRDGRQVAV